MSLFAFLNDTKFGVGDRVKVFQKITEKEKTRSQVFEGIVIKIKGEGQNKTFTVRRIGANQIGIEKIFPLSSPTLEKIVVLKSGTSNIRRAKLYYLRNKAKREIDEIYMKKSSTDKIIKKTSVKKGHRS